MRSLLTGTSSHDLGTIVARSAGVVLLIPLVLLAGLVAIVAMAALALTRRAGILAPADRRAPAARARRLERDAALGVVTRHAA